MVILLTLHVIFALIVLISLARVVWFVHKKQTKKADKGLRLMWINTIFTALSGGILMVLTGAIGRTCISMFAFVAVVMFVYGYQKSLRLTTAEKL